MTDADMDDLEAFLRTLTDEDALPAIVGTRMTAASGDVFPAARLVLQRPPGH